MIVRLLIGLLLLLTLASCSESPEVVAQRERIQREPLGDYYVGRRFFLHGTRLWGYVRRPRESWSKAKLVIMGEHIQTQPDRLPELNLYGDSHGYDHNYEYHLQGHFSDVKLYDPNSNLIVPEFVLRSYTEVSKNGGFLVTPGDMNNQKRLPELW